MDLDIQHLLMEMFSQWSGQQVTSIFSIPPSGSQRQYIRIQGENKSALGVYNSDRLENEAFIGFTKHFKEKDLKVPEVYLSNLDKDVYLIEDLGEINLFDYMQQVRINDSFPDELLELYKNTVGELVNFQTKGSVGLDYKLCYPRKAFDRQSMHWDLCYFKYYFLKLANIPFDEQALEDDFSTLINFLLSAKQDYFLYRDFQSRNIMIRNGETWFIDYQGGRKGALQYDIASLLYDGKADIPENIREILLNEYLNKLSKVEDINRKEFTDIYYGYVYIRIMQAMGTYGFRGFYQQKEHFLKSIPYALQNISNLLTEHQLPINTPELNKVLNLLINNKKLRQINALTVNITSFSYKRGIPFDMSGNGGGFVFDCRAIHNPGRYEKYKTLTGKDTEVINFFKAEPEMEDFLSDVFSIVSKSVDKYLSRGFKNLMVNFGCTGGQHRSVYCAENLAEFLNNKYDITVNIKHVEQEIKNV